MCRRTHCVPLLCPYAGSSWVPGKTEEETAEEEGCQLRQCPFWVTCLLLSSCLVVGDVGPQRQAALQVWGLQLCGTHTHKHTCTSCCAANIRHCSTTYSWPCYSFHPGMSLIWISVKRRHSPTITSQKSFSQPALDTLWRAQMLPPEGRGTCE